MESKRYIVDFYDSFDGWCNMAEFYGWTFDSLDDAKKLCDDKMKVLDPSNKKMGEHYGVIDTRINREVYCTQERSF
jgi:hypothetical protein